MGSLDEPLLIVAIPVQAVVKAIFGVLVINLLS